MKKNILILILGLALFNSLVLAQDVKISSTTELIEQLKSRQVPERLQAEQTLIARGEEALPLLLAALSAESNTLRQGVIKILGEMKAPEAALHLIPLVKTSSPPVKIATIWALQKIGTPEVIPTLLDCLNETNSSVKVAAFAALAQLKVNEVPIKTLFRTLNDENFSIRYYSSQLTQKLSDKNLPQIMEALQAKDPQIRASAIEIIAQFKESAIIALPDLIIYLKDEDEKISNAAAKTIQKIGPKTLPYLGNLLRSPEERIVKKTMALIRTFAGEAALVAFDIAHCLSHSNVGIRYSAAALLEEIGEPAVPATINALESKDRKTARSAIRILLELKSVSTIHPLMAALNHEDIDIQLMAAEALSQIEAASLALEKSTSFWAIWALGLQKEKAFAAIPSLIQLLAKEDLQTQWFAAQALGNMNKKALGAIAALETLLESENEELRAIAQKSINQITGQNEIDIDKVNAGIERILQHLASSDSKVKLSLSYDKENTNLEQDTIALLIGLSIPHSGWSPNSPTSLAAQIKIQRGLDNFSVITPRIKVTTPVFSLLDYFGQVVGIPNIKNLADLEKFFRENLQGPFEINLLQDEEQNEQFLQIHTDEFLDLSFFIREFYHIPDWEEGLPLTLKIYSDSIHLEGTFGLNYVPYDEVIHWNLQVMKYLQSDLLILPEELGRLFRDMEEFGEEMMSW